MDDPVDKSLDSLREHGIGIERRDQPGDIEEASARGALRRLAGLGRRLVDPDDLLRYPKGEVESRGGQFRPKGSPRGAVRRALPEVRGARVRQLLADAAKRRARADEALGKGRPDKAMALRAEARALETEAMASPDTATPRISYHLTNNPNFSLRDMKPEAGWSVADALGPGLFVTDDPDSWRVLPLYRRPFIVELEHPDRYENAPVDIRDPIITPTERFIPADELDDVKVRRVIPFTAWQDERYEEKPYAGPDVREMSPEEQQAILDESSLDAVINGGMPIDQSDLSEEAKEKARQDYPKRYESERKYIRDYPEMAVTGYELAYLDFINSDSTTAADVLGLDPYERAGGGTTEEWDSLPLEKRLELAERQEGEAMASPDSIESAQRLRNFIGSVQMASPDPETLARLVEKVKKDRSGSRRPDEKLLANDEAAEHLARLVESANLGIRMTGPDLLDILRDGEIKTAADLPTDEVPNWRSGRGLLGETAYRATREQAERLMFGEPNQTVYGYFIGTPEEEAVRPDTPGIQQYGNVIVELDESVKARTTYIAGDSLNSALEHTDLVVPTPIGTANKDAVNVSLGRFDTPLSEQILTMESASDIWKTDLPQDYIEAHIHGSRPTVTDISRVVFLVSADRLANPPRGVKPGVFAERAARLAYPEQIRALDEAGIPWVAVRAEPDSADFGSSLDTPEMAEGGLASPDWPEGITVGPSTPRSRDNGQRVAAVKRVMNELLTRWPEAADLGIRLYYADDDESTPFADYISQVKSDPAVRPGSVPPASQGRIVVPFSGREITEIVPIEGLTPSLMLYSGGSFGFPPAFYKRVQSLAGEEASPPVFVLDVAVGSGPVRPDPEETSVGNRWRRSWPHYHEMVVRHEIGHLVADTITLRRYGPDFLAPDGDDPSPGDSGWYDDYFAWSERRDERLKEVLVEYGITPEELADLSPYGTTSPHEAFAELYTAVLSDVPMDEALREKFLNLMRSELPEHSMDPVAMASPDDEAALAFPTAGEFGFTVSPADETDLTESPETIRGIERALVGTDLLWPRLGGASSVYNGISVLGADDDKSKAFPDAADDLLYVKRDGAGDLFSERPKRGYRELGEFTAREWAKGRLSNTAAFTSRIRHRSRTYQTIIVRPGFAEASVESAAIERSQQAASEPGWVPFTVANRLNGVQSHAEATLIHEVGHLVGDRIVSATNGDPTIEGYQALFDKYRITPEEFAGLSRYATTSPLEAFAELYAAYYGGLIDEMDPALRDKFEELMTTELPGHAIRDRRYKIPSEGLEARKREGLNRYSDWPELDSLFEEEAPAMASPDSALPLSVKAGMPPTPLSPLAESRPDVVEIIDREVARLAELWPRLPERANVFFVDDNRSRPFDAVSDAIAASGQEMTNPTPLDMTLAFDTQVADGKDPTSYHITPPLPKELEFVGPAAIVYHPALRGDAWFYSTHGRLLANISGVKLAPDSQIGDARFTYSDWVEMASLASQIDSGADELVALDLSQALPDGKPVVIYDADGNELGVLTRDHLAQSNRATVAHEIGHAVGASIVGFGPRHKKYVALFEKYGIGPTTLADGGLTEYGSTAPVEAFAELYALLMVPELRDTLSDELAEKFENLLRSEVPDHKMPAAPPDQLALPGMASPDGPALDIEATGIESGGVTDLAEEYPDQMEAASRAINSTAELWPAFSDWLDKVAVSDDIEPALTHPRLGPPEGESAADIIAEAPDAAAVTASYKDSQRVAAIVIRPVSHGYYAQASAGKLLALETGTPLTPDTEIFDKSFEDSMAYARWRLVSSSNPTPYWGNGNLANTGFPVTEEQLADAFEVIVIHEVGHIVGDAILGSPAMDEEAFLYINLFEKYGITPEEIAAVSEMGTTHPAEAFAELYAFIRTPKLAESMPQGTRQKFETLLTTELPDHALRQPAMASPDGRVIRTGTISLGSGFDPDPKVSVLPKAEAAGMAPTPQTALAMERPDTIEAIDDEVARLAALWPRLSERARFYIADDRISRPFAQLPDDLSDDRTIWEFSKLGGKVYGSGSDDPLEQAVQEAPSFHTAPKEKEFWSLGIPAAIAIQPSLTGDVWDHSTYGRRLHQLSGLKLTRQTSIDSVGETYDMFLAVLAMNQLGRPVAPDISRYGPAGPSGGSKITREHLVEALKIKVTHETGHAVGAAIVGVGADKEYVQLFEKYGITPEEIAGVSKYATVAPVESFAELYAAFMSPLVDEMDPTLRGKFTRLMEAEVPDHKLSSPAMASPDVGPPPDLVAERNTPYEFPGVEAHEQAIKEELIEWLIFQDEDAALYPNSAMRWEIDNGDPGPGPFFRGQPPSRGVAATLTNAGPRSWSKNPAVAVYHAPKVIVHTDGRITPVAHETQVAGPGQMLAVEILMTDDAPRQGFDISKRQTGYQWESEVILDAANWPKGSAAKPVRVILGGPGEQVSEEEVYERVDKVLREEHGYTGPKLENPFKAAQAAMASPDFEVGNSQLAETNSDFIEGARSAADAAAALWPALSRVPIRVADDSRSTITLPGPQFITPVEMAAPEDGLWGRTLLPGLANPDYPPVPSVIVLSPSDDFPGSMTDPDSSVIGRFLRQQALKDGGPTREHLADAFGVVLTHEIGHAVLHRILKKVWDEKGLSSNSVKVRDEEAQSLLQEYGITPEEIAGVSRYATVSPVEAFAELYAMRFSSVVEEMNPALREKFDRLLTTEMPSHRLEAAMASPDIPWPDWEREDSMFPISSSPRQIFDGPRDLLPDSLTKWIADNGKELGRRDGFDYTIRSLMGWDTYRDDRFPGVITLLDAVYAGLPITLYRAVPRDGRHGTMPGAFVTPSRRYAEQHGESNLDGDYKVVTVTATPDELLSYGDPLEFLWAPKNQRDALRQSLAATYRQGPVAFAGLPTNLLVTASRLLGDGDEMGRAARAQAADNMAALDGTTASPDTPISDAYRADIALMSPDLTERTPPAGIKGNNPVLDADPLGAFIRGPERELLMARGKVYHRDDAKVSDRYDGLPGTPKMCYSNAGRVALGLDGFDFPELTYVEGYAISSLGIPLGHAWLVDEDGNVIDKTWPEGSGYFGIPIPRDGLAKIVLNSGVWGVLNGVGWQGEEYESLVREAVGMASPDETVEGEELDAEARGYEPLPGGEWFGAGGCAHLALAAISLYPDLKIAAGWYDDHGRRALGHAVAYDPKTNVAYDFVGIHEYADIAVSDYSELGIEMNQDPAELARQMDIRWTPEEPWADDSVFDGAEFFERWFEGEMRKAGIQPSSGVQASPDADTPEEGDNASELLDYEGDDALLDQLDLDSSPDLEVGDSQTAAANPHLVEGARDGIRTIAGLWPGLSDVSFYTSDNTKSRIILPDGRPVSPQRLWLAAGVGSDNDGVFGRTLSSSPAQPQRPFPLVVFIQPKSQFVGDGGGPRASTIGATITKASGLEIEPESPLPRPLDTPSVRDDRIDTYIEWVDAVTYEGVDPDPSTVGLAITDDHLREGMRTIVIHEIGHAVHHKIIAARFLATGRVVADSEADGVERNMTQALFEEYGITPQEIATISEYATTSPNEAFAELYATRFSILGGDMDPALREKFDNLMRGELPEHKLPETAMASPDEWGVGTSPLLSDTEGAREAIEDALSVIRSVWPQATETPVYLADEDTPLMDTEGLYLSGAIEGRSQFDFVTNEEVRAAAFGRPAGTRQALSEVSVAEWWNDLELLGVLGVTGSLWASGEGVKARLGGRNAHRFVALNLRELRPFLRDLQKWGGSHGLTGDPVPEAWRKFGITPEDAADAFRSGSVAGLLRRVIRHTVIHEFGHIVGGKIVDPPTPSSEEVLYRGLLEKYRITPEEIASISEYATTSPTEAFAEIYAMMFSELADGMDPDLREKFSRLLREELPEHQIPEFAQEPATLSAR